jgi:hypothetical protein
VYCYLDDLTQWLKRLWGISTDNERHHAG